MTYRYGRDWHPTLRKPIKEIAESAARKHWANGTQFSVSRVTEPPGGVPDFTLVVGPQGQDIRSTRYDEYGSSLTVYDFSLLGTDEAPMFLTDVTVYVYPDEQQGWLDLHQAKAHTQFTFGPNGWARSRFAVHGQDQARIQEFTGVDVSAHWVQAPGFGDWDRFGIPREPELPGT